MAAPKGNQFWRNIPYEKIGRPLGFETPEILWEECKLYFEECDKSPFIKTESTVGERGDSVKTSEHKIPYTWLGLCVFLSVCDLDAYKKREEFSGVIKVLDNIIRNQKFSGAAAGLFNSNIIARDLGLVEKKQVENKEEEIDLSNLDDEEILNLTLLQKKAKGE